MRWATTEIQIRSGPSLRLRVKCADDFGRYASRWIDGLFMLGLPSNICLEDCDTKSPRNLLDSNFDVDTQILPASRSENEATKLLWFIVKDGQMISFSKVAKTPCRSEISQKQRFFS
jgi:hypothetical protein